MPSPIHTTIVDLLEAHPEVLSYLLGLQGPAPVGPLVPANGTTSATFTIERRVDSAFLLGSSNNPGGFVLVEVQLGRDRDKVFAWALYVELARSRYRCEGALVVLTIQGRVRRWIERDIARRTGQLGSWRQLQPLVIALDEIAPAMLLRAEMPYLAPLAVAAHARSPDVAEIAGRAVDLTAMKSLPTPLAIEQLDAILAMVDAGLRAALEKRAMKHSEFRSKFFRDLAAKFTAEGVAKGVAKGAAEGRAEAILEIFAARGLPVSESIRARVLGCTDIETLQHWQVRALVASSAAAAVRENPPSKAAPPPQTPRKSGGRSTARSTKSAGGKRAESAKQPG